MSVKSKAQIGLDIDVGIGRAGAERAGCWRRLLCWLSPLLR